MAASGQIAHIYDKQAYAPYISQIVKEGGGLPKFNNYYFIRPAFEAFLYVPFSWMPYATASASAVVMNLLILGILVWKLPIWYGVRSSWRPIIRLGLTLFYPFHWTIMVGQDTLLLTLIIAYAWRLASSGADTSAGLLLALGTYKPHLIWAMPLVMIVQKRPRMLAAFLAVSALLAASSLLAVGPAGMHAWIRLLQDPSSDIMPQIMGNIRALALHFGPAVGIVAVCVVVLCLGLILWKGKPYQQLTAALFAPVLLSPHSYWQDYSLVSIVAVAEPYALAPVLLLAPWPYFYPPLDEFPMIFLSIASLAALAIRLRSSSQATAPDGVPASMSSMETANIASPPDA